MVARLTFAAGLAGGGVPQKPDGIRFFREHTRMLLFLE